MHKRKKSERSPNVSEMNKKINLNKMPTKSIDFSETMADTELMSSEKKKKYDEIVESDAPGWFKNAFSFIIDTVTDDLHKIQVKLESANNVKQQCETNTAQIEDLKGQICNLEVSNETLQRRVTQMEITAKKNNLIIHGQVETGPTEIAYETVLKISREVLDMADADKLEILQVFRIGKPPHLQVEPRKYPRDILIKFKLETDRDKVWRLKGKLKGTKVSIQEDLTTILERLF